MADAVDVLSDAVDQAGAGAVVMPPGAARLVLDEVRAHRVCLMARTDRGVSADAWQELYRARATAVAASRAGA